MEVPLIFKLNHFYMYHLLKKNNVAYDQICFDIYFKFIYFLFIYNL